MILLLGSSSLRHHAPLFVSELLLTSSHPLQIRLRWRVPDPLSEAPLRSVHRVDWFSQVKVMVQPVE